MVGDVWLHCWSDRAPVTLCEVVMSRLADGSHGESIGQRRSGGAAQGGAMAWAEQQQLVENWWSVDSDR